MTINEAMVLQKTIRQRVSDLSSLRNANAVERNTYYRIGNDVEEKKREELKVQYDPKKLDAKIVELELFLFKVDTAIKRANAKAEVDIVADMDKLLAPIE